MMLGWKKDPAWRSYYEKIQAERKNLVAQKRQTAELLDLWRSRTTEHELREATNLRQMLTNRSALK
jgi:uncharacterized phage-associated protein